MITRPWETDAIGRFLQLNRREKGPSFEQAKPEGGRANDLATTKSESVNDVFTQMVQRLVS